MGKTYEKRRERVKITSMRENVKFKVINEVLSALRKEPLLEHEISEILDYCKDGILKKVKVSDIPVGETFKIGKYEFIVLEHNGDTTAVILKSLLVHDEEVGDYNDYQNSNLDNICNNFAVEIAKIVGKKNLIEHTVDLTSLDNLDDYGKIRRKMSLLTCDLYRRYVNILDKYKLSEFWWLATPLSTDTHGNCTDMMCILTNGTIDHEICFCPLCGIRPFCILKSDTPVFRK